MSTNRLKAPQHFALCKWLETIRAEVTRDHLRASQIARRAAAKLGHPVTTRNVSYAARAIGLELMSVAPRRGGPRQRLRSAEVLAAALLEADVRVRLLACELASLLAELGRSTAALDHWAEVDRNVERIARGVAMVPNNYGD